MYFEYYFSIVELEFCEVEVYGKCLIKIIIRIFWVFLYIKLIVGIDVYIFLIFKGCWGIF